MQNPLKQIRSFPSPNFVRLLFAALIFPLSGTSWVETTFYNNFTLIPSVASLWDQLGKDERDYITELGRAPQSSERGQTWRVAPPPSCVLYSPEGLFLVRADSLTFACCSLCHKVSLPSRSKEPTHGNICCGWPCQSLSLWASLTFSLAGSKSWDEGLPWILWHVGNADCKEWSLMFLREIFLSSKGCLHFLKDASSCAPRKTHPEIIKMQQNLH